MVKFENIIIKRKGEVLISDFNANVASGQFIILTGSNGAGKSTLLKTLVGLLPITNGDIIIQNKAMSQFSHLERSQTIAYVNSQKIEDEYIRLIDLVRIGRYPYLKVQHTLIDDEIDITNILKALGIESIKEKYLNEVSDGELQKASISRALVQDTPILVLDEPTAFLDYPSKKDLFQLLKTLATEKNKTILCATHDVELAALYGTQFWHLENKVISLSDKSIAWTKI